MQANISLKGIILSLLLMAAGGATFAQCNQTSTFTASRTSYLNDKGVEERTKDEETIITFNKNVVDVSTNGSHELDGTVKTYTCNWDKPYQNGKTVITTLIVDGGQSLNATITIVGKDGKITLTFEAPEMPGEKIQLVATKFE